MSENYNKVKLFYDEELWSLEMVCNAIDRWITKEEFVKITGKENDELSR
jgi:hypothetical protein